MTAALQQKFFDGGTAQPVPLSYPAVGSIFDIDFVGARVAINGVDTPSAQGWANTAGRSGDLLKAAITQINPNYIQKADGTLTKSTLQSAIRRSDLGACIFTNFTWRGFFNCDLTNAAWTPVNLTPSKSGDLSRANTTVEATRLTAGGVGPCTIAQVFTLASGITRPYLEAKRIAGNNGPLFYSVDGGITQIQMDPATWTGLTLAGWMICDAAPQTLVNPTLMITITPGDTWVVSFVGGTNRVSTKVVVPPFLVVGSTINNFNDRPYANLTDGSPLLTLIQTAQPLWIYRDFNYTYQDASTGLYKSDGTYNSGIQDTAIQAEASITGLPNMLSPSIMGGNPHRLFTGNDGVFKYLSIDGSDVAKTASGGLYTAPTHWDLLTNGAGNACVEGWIKRFIAYANKPSDAQIKYQTNLAN